MNSIQGANHGGKGFARSLKDLICDRMNCKGFVGNLNVPHELRDFAVRDLVSQPESVDSPQPLDAPQRAAVCSAPLPPNPHGIWLPQKDTHNDRSVYVHGHRRLRSSKSDFNPDSECLDLIPLSFRKSLTGRVGSTIWAPLAAMGRIRATWCRCEVIRTSSPDLTKPR